VKRRSAAGLGLAAVAWLAFAAFAMHHHWEVGEWLALAGMAMVMAVAAWLWHAGERQRRSWQQTLDAMQAGVVVYDDDDRVHLVNAHFRQLYRLSAADTARGTRFEDLLRTRVRAGLVPEAAGREEPWIAERAAEHRASRGGSLLRQMVGGGWRRITEQRLPDGSLLSFSIDVSELVEHQRALDAARLQAEQAQRLLGDAIDAMPAAVEIYDREDRLVLFNRRMVELYPHMQGQSLTGETFDTLVRRALAAGRVPEALGREDAWLAERMATRGRGGEPRLQSAPGATWVHIYETPMPGGGLVTVRLDATEIVRQRDELGSARDAADASRAALQDAIDAMPAGVEIYDAQDRLVIFNRRLAQIYPHVAEQMSLGQTFESLVRRSVELGMISDARGQEQAWVARRMAQRREARGDAPLLQRSHDGRWMHIYETRGPGGNVIGVRLDVSELVRQREQLDAANAALAHLSATDALTKLANRRRFDERYAEELQRARRHATPLALLMVDVDHFKRFNDRHGHPEGDRALRAVAAVLAQQARRPGELVARIGGEEFALLLPQADGPTALAVAAHCHEAIERLALPHGDSPTAAHLTLSLGAALWRAHEDGATLMARADAALYAAKAAGRARCVLAQEPA
jgi:diguanylate cyclase (GGDEF)-like protein